jgi:polyisoprenoid-binding protein YceI
MTNYLVPFLVAALMASAACADDQSPAPAAAKPAPAPKPMPAAKPVAASATAPAATPAGAVPHYVQAASGSTLTFIFDQTGAQTEGSFKQFTTTFDYDEKNPDAGKLSVKVQIASLDTQDADRDSALAGADLFNAQKFPAATYVADSLTKGADGGLVAAGKLTLRGVTKPLRVPLAVRATATGLELSGETQLKRLDYGVGQGDFQSTESVGDLVKLRYKVALVKAAGTAQ